MNKWYKIALLNLCILAFAGTLLRYKINFPLPFVEQGNLLFAHSHFAFNGWISFILYVIIIDYFTDSFKINSNFWNRFLWLYTIANYAMFISFIWQGYSPLSETIEIFTVLLSYVFAWKIFKSIPSAKQQLISTRFLKAGTIFLIISSLGTYALAYLFITRDIHEYWSHNAVYWYLHFQYNGWFTFAIIGFLIQRLEQSNFYNKLIAYRIYLLLVITCVPAYLLAALWHQRPVWVTVTNIISVLLQTASLYYLWKLLWTNRHSVYDNLPRISRWLLSLSISAFVIKVLLQFFSAHPLIGQLAYGYRSVVIGYLHLVFLAFVTLFMLGLLSAKKIIPLGSKTARWGLIAFTAGVFINELLLVLQGIFSIMETSEQYLSKYLFYNTLLLLIASISIFFSSLKRGTTD